MAGYVISEVHALPYVVVSRAEKHVPCGELVRNTERITLQPRRRTNRSRYNRVPVHSTLKDSHS